MKKIILYSIVILTILLLVGCKTKVFTLEDKYYETNEFVELDKNTYNKLTKNKESFAIFIYQNMCAASDAFEKVLNEYLKEHKVSFYRMSFAEMKKTNLSKKIKYYPSFVIIKDGKIVDYLDSSRDKDTKYYKTANGFNEWFSQYVEVSETKIKFPDTNNQNNSQIDVTLDNVSYDENKVNIYFFWGNGCPHCEAEHQFFERIKNEYGKYYTLNEFEVWYNQDNQKIFEQFAAKMGDEASGVPYTIIGNKTFIGFNESYEQEIIEAITSQHKNSHDVYFDNKQ